MRMAFALLVSLASFGPMVTFAAETCACSEKCMTECRSGKSKGCTCKACDCAKSGQCSHDKCMKSGHDEHSGHGADEHSNH